MQNPVHCWLSMQALWVDFIHQKAADPSTVPQKCQWCGEKSSCMFVALEFSRFDTELCMGGDWESMHTIYKKWTQLW